MTTSRAVWASWPEAAAACTSWARSDQSTEKKGSKSPVLGYSIRRHKMRKVPSLLPSSSGSGRALDLARVLLVHGDLAPRLALQTILQAGGYSVDVAASPAEALSKLDEGRYSLVLR